jgi:hypothetical protein
MQTSRSCAQLVRLTVTAILGFLLMTLAPAAAWSQGSPTRFEVGAGFTATHVGLEAFGPSAQGDVNFGRHVAFDAVYSWLPTPTPQHMMTALFGAKVGTRTQHFGFFGKVRPGLISFGDSVRQANIIFNPDGTVSSSFRTARQNEKALDLGGVFEYYPARHWALRWDAGDLMVFNEAPLQITVSGNVPPDFITSPPSPGQTTHNFLFSTAIQYRF